MFMHHFSIFASTQNRSYLLPNFYSHITCRSPFGELPSRKRKVCVRLVVHSCRPFLLRFRFNRWRHAEWQCEHESCPVPRQVFSVDTSAMRFNHGAANRQTQPDTTHRRFRRGPGEFVEQACRKFSGDTGAVVGDRDFEPVAQLARSDGVVESVGVYSAAFSSRLQSTRSISKASNLTNGKSAGKCVTI